MSPDGISALERGHRRNPHKDTVALLAEALALDGTDRETFEASAVRPASPRRRGPSKITEPVSEAAPPALPLAMTTFVGRDAAVAEIIRLVNEVRLVTLTGAGGVGKTQAALRAGARLSQEGPCEVRLATLSPLTDPALVSRTIASSFGIQEVPHRWILDALVAHLKTKTILLILDGCERVVAEAASVVSTILPACPAVKVLATSREPLWAGGERVYRLPPLDLPPHGAARLSAVEAGRYAAISLFADRARAVDHRFEVSDENAAVIAEVCRRLDGLPLAIELAAARVNVVPLKTLNDQMDDRFRFMTSRDRTVLPRQQTLHATIEWSYELLSPAEQLLFERLAVFSGGGVLEAVEAVAQDAVLAERDVLEILTSLAEKSLVIADMDAPVVRYRLLEIHPRVRARKASGQR